MFSTTHGREVRADEIKRISFTLPSCFYKDKGNFYWLTKSPLSLDNIPAEISVKLAQAISSGSLLLQLYHRNLLKAIAGLNINFA